MTVKQKTRSLTEQGAWLLAARLIGFAFGFALPLLLVRRLDQTSVGLYKQAFLTIATTAGILPLGFSMSAFYFLSREDELNRKRTVFNILLFNFLVGGIACLVFNLFPNLLGAVFQSVEMTRLAPVIGFVVWFWIFSSFLEVVAVANRETYISTAFIISAQLTKTIFLAGAAFFFATVEALIYAALIQTVVQTIVLSVYLNRRFPRFWREFDFAFFRKQAVYALPLGFAGVIWTMQTDLHNYFVSHKFSAAEFAVYSFGCFELPLLGMLSEAISSVLIPRMSELQSLDKKRDMLDLVARAMNKLALIYLPVYVLMMIVAESFMVTLFTENFRQSAPIFRINLTLLPFYIIATDSIVRAYKELGRFLLVLRIVFFVALVALLWFGINNFDLRGMIAIVVCISISERIIATFRVGQKLNVTLKDLPLLANVGKIAIASIIAGSATFAAYLLTQNALPVVNLLICGIVFAPIYLTLVVIFKAIPEEDKERAVNLFKSFTNRLRSKSKVINNPTSPETFAAIQNPKPKT
ncbi:MAG: oligosaccharide flippase family protein [Pyrinomonadaceae bacterium]|nr:oligosaccharide flippase family protein [Pyrinomonadaceae bacterium]